jgi:hypothetical protein
LSVAASEGVTVRVPLRRRFGYDVCMTHATGEPRAKKTRTIRLLQAPGSDGVGVLCVTVGGESTLYVLREISCEIGGRGFAVSRLGLGAQYHVRIDPALDESTCECMGFLRHGYCKHVLGLYALVRAGKL